MNLNLFLLNVGFHVEAIWHKIVAELEAKRRVFFAMVITCTRGSPGTPLSVLLVTEDGKQFGTIGGGFMEHRLIQLAQKALRKGQYVAQLSRLEHRNTGLDNSSGLICGGSQTNLLAVIDPSYLDLAKTVAEHFNNDLAGVLSFSAETWIFEPGRLSSRPVWMEQTSEWKVHLSTANRKRIAIFGGGHCGAALARQMIRLGYSVSLIEPRTDLFTLDDIPQIAVINTNTFTAGASLINFPEISFAVVLTSSSEQDIDALKGILNYPFPFIGVMGSYAKITKIRKSLSNLGFNEESWKRVTAPVGLSIESDTPEEIAVSISAQILNESRKLGLR